VPAGPPSWDGGF